MRLVEKIHTDDFHITGYLTEHRGEILYRTEGAIALLTPRGDDRDQLSDAGVQDVYDRLELMGYPIESVQFSWEQQYDGTYVMEINVYNPSHAGTRFVTYLNRANLKDSCDLEYVDEDIV